MSLVTILKSLGAVVAGFIAIVVLSVVTDAVFEQIGVIPRGALFATGPLLLALTYRLLYSIAGCHVAARLAPSRPMGHALALGAVGVMMSTLGAVTAQALSPAWYAWSLVVLALPCAWVGGRLARNG